MKKHLSNLMLVLVFVAGLSLLLYPTVSDYWNSFHQSYAVASYSDTVAKMDQVSYQSVWDEARAYNQTLLTKRNRFYMKDSEREAYAQLLNVGGNGIMGTVEIPKIKVSLPIYHGTDEAVLQVAIGHLEGSSLPVGGEGTHCVVSGHRGLPSAKLFSNLDQMKLGDTFMLHVLDETLTYEVDQILVVEPDEVDALEIDPAQDLCTLITCTPYGINTHRLLVRGHRVATEEAKPTVHISSDASMIDPLTVSAVVAVPLLLVWLLWLIFAPRKR